MKISAIKTRPLLILFLLVSLYPSVNAQTSLTLHDSLTAAIEKQSNELRKQEAQLASEGSSITWLDGSPSISLMYLDSQESLGTTESEISLNLPIKSPLLRQVEKTLFSQVESLRNTAEQQYALYLSGMIRNILWDIQIEKVSAATLTRKQSILSSLDSHFKDLTEAQAIPQYVSLIVQKELNDHSVAFLQHQQNINNLLGQYQRLTGLRALPTDMNESVPNSNTMNINSHPDLLALDTTFKSLEQTLLSASKQTSPWNVQIIGKRVEAEGLSENQLGIGIEVPINIGKQLSAVQQSEYTKASTEYKIARSKLLHQLSEAQANLVQEYDFLKQKQSLLSAGMANLQALNTAMQDLREANAPNQEFYLRTLLDTVDSEQAIALNRVYIQRHIALMRQAAGITL